MRWLLIDLYMLCQVKNGRPDALTCVRTKGFVAKLQEQVEEDLGKSMKTPVKDLAVHEKTVRKSITNDQRYK